MNSLIYSVRNQHFPMALPGEITARIMPDRPTARTEIEIINRQIFRPDELRLFNPPIERQEANEPLRANFMQSLPEWIVFYRAVDEPGGWFYGYMIEPTEYFIDTIGFIPAMRGKGLYTAFLKKLLPYLKELGFERVSTTHHPNNRAILIAELKAGFNITGLELHESHGPSIKMSCFIHDDRRKAFEDAFTMVPETVLNKR